MDAFDVRIDERRVSILAIALIRRGPIDPRRIFSLVFVKNDVAFGIECRFQQPFENAGRIGGVGDPATRPLAVNAGDVVFRDGAPMRISIGLPLPAFYSRERSFDTRAVAFYRIGLSV